jgi:predicted nucleic acid-binding Zn finger protein
LYERDEESRKDGEGEWEWECVTQIALNPNLIGKKQYRKVTYEEGSDGKAWMTLSPRNYIVQEVSCSCDIFLVSAVEFCRCCNKAKLT